MRRAGVDGPIALVMLLAVVMLAAGCSSSTGGEDAEVQPGLSADEADPKQADAEDSTSATGDTDGGTEDQTAEELFPDVVEATAEMTEDGVWTFSATLSSPYDTPERYADGWRVIGPDGTVYGTRPLAHDHQSEQPFTRSQSGIEIPADVTEVTVEGRDQISGWGGMTVQVQLTS